jgi:hypothetical protein
MKGTRYVALDRQLAEFVVRDPIAIKLYNWVADMISGDESFFSTLAVISGTNNGSVVQDLNKNTDNGLESGFKMVVFTLASFPVFTVKLSKEKESL